MTAQATAKCDGWAPSLEQLICDLWAKGQSAAVIAKHPKMIAAGKSRNAVIGKIHRFGLARRQTTQRVASLPPRYVAKARKAGEGNYAGSVPKLRALRERMVVAEPLPKITVKLDDPLPRECSVGVDIEGLDSWMCRYILTSNHPHRYCGLERKPGSWCCFAHYAVCYTAPRQARIVPPFKRAA